MTTDRPAPCCAATRELTEGKVVASAPEEASSPSASTEGMVRLDGGSFLMGTDSTEGFPADGEGPVREVYLDPFYIDACAVTNAQFKQFVDETGYETEAERYGWSFVFYHFLPAKKAKHARRVQGAPWWCAVRGACWKWPEGRGSCISDRMDHPVVYVSWNDAVAYCQWAGKRLPTEAEWEYAARGGLEQKTYPWGDSLTPNGEHHCNIWQGTFPQSNTEGDGYRGTAPIRSYSPNGFGLCDVAGNAWEWCADWFSRGEHLGGPRENPVGPPDGEARVNDETVMADIDLFPTLCHLAGVPLPEGVAFDVAGRLHEGKARCKRKITMRSKEMRFNVAFFIVLLLGLSWVPAVTAQQADSLSTVDITYAVGADFSFLKHAEATGTVFKDDGVAKPGLEIFKNHGYNWIRLRLFHSPTRLPNDLEYTIALAQEAKELGYKFLLDYHYSDTWADPGKQYIPEAWKGLSPEVLADSVYAYTRRTIAAFREAGVMPEMVQIGNEIRNGMLWPVGKLPEHWDNFAALLEAGIAGVKAGSGQAPRPLIMIHYDNGADAEGTRAFYEKINSYGITYDVIGLSYYPWWHGNLLSFQENLLSLVNNFDKDVILVETAYNWKPTAYEDPALAPFPETPEGQREFLESVNETLLNISSPKIKGIFWWEPAVMEESGLRSRGFFDDEGNALPVMEVFDKYREGEVED